MAFFDVINDILFHKRGDKLDNVDQYSDFSPFLVNRWCSMYSPDMCHIINQTMNRYHSLFEDKKLMYNLYVKLLPRVKQRFIRYIKKPKKDSQTEQEDVENLDVIASGLELSKREINMYIQYEREHRSTDTN